MTGLETIEIWIDYERQQIAYQHEPRDPVFVDPDEARQKAAAIERDARSDGRFVEPLSTLVEDLREHAITLERAIDEIDEEDTGNGGGSR